MIRDIAIAYDELKHVEPAPKKRAAHNRASLPLRTSSPALTRELHPAVYKLIMALAAWFALAAWGFFAPSRYTGVVLAVVSLFVLIAVGLPYVLSLIARRRRGLEASAPPPDSLAAWLKGDFDTWQARIKASDAAVAILLPILAGAFGMTAFAIVLHFAVRHAS